MATATIQAAKLTRPNDTTAYAVGDGIAASAGAGAVIEIPNATTSANDTSVLFGVQCTTSQKANQSGLRIHFWSVGTGLNAGTLIADNAAFKQKIEDEATYLSYIDLDSFVAEDTTNGSLAVAHIKNLSFPLKSDAAKSVWFQVELKTTAFTPDALQTFLFTFWVVKN